MLNLITIIISIMEIVHKSFVTKVSILATVVALAVSGTARATSDVDTQLPPLSNNLWFSSLQ